MTQNEINMNNWSWFTVLIKVEQFEDIQDDLQSQTLTLQT